MRKSFLYLTLGFVAAAFVTIYSCTKRVNGINNDQVIETPYGLFFSDTAGNLFVTNDGKTVKTIFKADGFPCRAICTDNGNILWPKKNLYISTNGVNFNHAYDSLTSYDFMACNGKWLNLNQSMIIDIPDWGKSFVCSDYPYTLNYLGVAFSWNQGGILGSWWIDLPDTAVVTGDPVSFGLWGNPPYVIRVTSFTLLKNGTLCGYDGRNNRNFYRTKTTLWSECTGNPDSAVVPGVGDPLNHSGTPLPHRIPAGDPPGYGFTAPVDTTAFYSYGHYNNRLIAIDNINCNGNGAYYSDDNGRNWQAYTGLPNKPLLCIASPFEEMCMIGTDSAGLYVLNNNTGVWEQQVANGLDKHIIVRNIAFKENIYKNGSRKKFVYLATNKGLYQSTNNGNNWSLTIPGNFVAVY
ncbi:MAG: hypothetical protein K0Q79_2256 [Flavipsychrobacter sp.]|jgi:hypothetical protein|nr:hypothetical protein [Flavipsychrobacter sp.]